MPVRLLHGIQSAALREKCLREVLDWTGRWPDKRAIILVPEQAKLDFEQAYLSQAGQAGYLGNLSQAGQAGKAGLLMAEVLSFRRLATSLFGEVGRLPGNTLQTSGQAMVLYRLLQDNRSRLKAFANLADKPGFIRQIATVLGDLRRFGIDARTLQDLEGRVEDAVLAHKVGDLATLAEAYSQCLLDLGLSDPDDDLDKLAALLSQPSQENRPKYADRLKRLSQTSVWIVGFGELRNFTPQEYAVIDQLQQRCEALTLTVMTESLPADELAVELGPDIFLPGRRTAYQLLRRYRPAECLHIEPTWPQANAAMAELLGSGQTAEQPGQPEKPDAVRGQNDLGSFVQLILTTNPEDQAAWLAGEIRRLVVEDHYRYRDLGVAVCNPADDLPRLQMTFAQYKIPLFLDQVRSVSGTALLRTILGVLDIAEKGWTRLPVMRILRAGLLTDDQDTVDRLENDILASGLFRLDQLLAGMPDQPSQADERLAVARREIFQPIQALVSQLKQSTHCQAMVEALASYLADRNLQQRCSLLIDELTRQQDSESALALAKSWNVLADLLAQLEQLAGQAPMSLATFRDLLAAGMDNADSGVLPSSLDQVAVGSLSRSRQRTAKILFVLGAQSASLPPSAPPEGLLKEHDRDSLSELLGQKLPNNARDQVYADAAMIFSLLTQPQERLVMIADAHDPSPYFQRLAEACGQKPLILPELPGYDDVRLNAPSAALNRLLQFCRQPGSPEPAEMAGFRALAAALSRHGMPLRPALGWLAKGSPLDVRVSLGHVQARFGKSLKMSISQLEKYAACPFSHLAAYGLSLQDRKIFEPEIAESGTLLHALAERSLTVLRDRLQDESDVAAVARLLESWLQGELDQVLQQTLEDIKDDPRMRAFFAPGLRASAGRRLERVARTSIAAILRQLLSETFRPALFEWTFSPGVGNPLVIQLDQDHDVLLRGVIDRVDQRQGENQPEFRVIDYKSGNKKVNYDTLYHGLALQLPAYLTAFQESHPDQQAVDACYFHFDQPILAQPAESQDDPAALAKKLDQHFELRSLDLEPDQLELLQKHTRIKISQWAGQIVAGQFSARPRTVSGGQLPCTYCDYAAICGYDARKDPCERFEPLGRKDKQASRKKKDDLVERLRQEELHAAD